MSSAEIVIAVHRTDRPVGRAAASVLDGASPRVGVAVVGHGLDTDTVRSLLPEGIRERVRVLSHVDAIPAPGGPFNAGLDSTAAQWCGVMGSDDTLEPGAVDAWLDLAVAHEADAVVARVVHSTGGVLRTPPVRALPLRARAARTLARDRLAYRTAPLGLMRTALLRAHGIRMTEGLASGEDLAFSTRLYALGQHIQYAAGAPAYVIGHGEAERITTSRRPVADDLQAVCALVAEPWFAALAPGDRTAVAIKLLRIHVFGACATRESVQAWSDADRAAARAGALAVVESAPAAVRFLSRAELALLSTLLDPAAPTSALVVRSKARRRHGMPSTLLTAAPEDMLGAQAPLRLMAASVLMR